MGLILLEALGALSALVLIVWWTMFSGRPKGELPAQPEPPAAGVQPSVAEASVDVNAQLPSLAPRPAPRPDADA